MSDIIGNKKTILNYPDTDNYTELYIDLDKDIWLEY